MRIAVLLVMMSVFVHAYVRSAHQQLARQSFAVGATMATYSFDDSVSKGRLMQVNGVFRMNDLFFGIHPIRLSDSNPTLTLYSVGWFVIENLSIYSLTWSTQLGMHALGDIRDIPIQMRPFFPQVSLSHEIRPEDWPLFMIWTLNLDYDSRVGSGVVVGIEDASQKLYVEYDEFMNQWYFGMDYRFFRQFSGTLALNISDHQSLDNPNVFYPSIKIGVNVLDVFSTQQAPVPQQPLPVDDASYLQMEKALLALQREQYQSAANLYAQVLQKYPNYALAYVRLGNCYYQMEQYEMAKKAWSEALRLDPGNDDVFMALVQLNNRQIQTQRLLTEP